MKLVGRGTFALALGLSALLIGGCSSGGAVLQPHAAATATPTPKPTATPSPSPTPTGTPTAAACTAPSPDPRTGSVTLTGAQQTVAVPCFGDFTATAAIPANSGAGVKVDLQSSTDNNLGSSPTFVLGTPLFYTSLQPSASFALTASGATIAVTVTSPSEISAGHTYAFSVYVPALAASVQQQNDIVPSGHSISFQVASPGAAFSATTAVVIVYLSS